LQHSPTHSLSLFITLWASACGGESAASLHLSHTHPRMGSFPTTLVAALGGELLSVRRFGGSKGAPFVFFLLVLFLSRLLGPCRRPISRAVYCAPCWPDLAQCGPWTKKKILPPPFLGVCHAFSPLPSTPGSLNPRPHSSSLPLSLPAPHATQVTSSPTTTPR